MSIQTKIPFPARKKSFYSNKNVLSKEDFNLDSSKTTDIVLTPKTKKLMELSDSESDSDTENIIVNKKSTKTPKRKKSPIKSKEKKGLTPPKQQKFLTPKTPSTLIDNLNINSPNSKNEKLVPKKLFLNKYSEARKALHSSPTEDLIGRQNEMIELEKFIKNNLKNNKSASLYVSGPPGTGKTACLTNIMLKPEFAKEFKIVYVNCTTIKSAAAIYSKIAQELNLKATKSGNKAAIVSYLKKSHKMLLLILDEMDQLSCTNQSVLYSIFEWPSIPNSNFILIGIANALDLTDRILPRLQAKCELKPTLLHFAAYNKQQILNIITERLKKSNVSDIISGPALQLLAGKVAAVSGDIRRALDICRRVVEYAESKNIMQELEMNNVNGNDSLLLLNDQKLNEKPVDFHDILSVLNGIYGGSKKADSQEMPLQQKIIICSLLLIINHAKDKMISVGKLQKVYEKVCKKQNIVALDLHETVSLLSLIQDRGILVVNHKKDTRLSIVNLQWDEETLKGVLQDKDLMSLIINDTSCL